VVADWVVGADIGKRTDPTALCIVERVRPPEWPGPDDPKRQVSGRVREPETVFVVREIGRLPLGTRHTVGAYKIASALHDLRVAYPTASIRFLLDVTGVGEGVADLIESYVPTSVKMTRCWFTGSERLDKRGREWHVGKPWMVSRLTSLLETGRVRLPDTPQSQALMEELRDFEYRVTPSANLVAEARLGAHDDFVTALGLATLVDGGFPRPQWATITPGLRPEEQPVGSWDVWASLGVDKPLPR
jgi:hypothetical protein